MREGNPALRSFCSKLGGAHRANLDGELVFLFIEERADRADHLEAKIAQLPLPAHFKWKVERGTFASTLGQDLDKLDAEGNQIAPTFALIDPLGFAGIPYALIRRLLAKNKCEVLITFMVDAVNRWLTHPDANVSDSTNPDQALLFTDPSIAPLAWDLAAAFRRAGQIPVKRIEECASTWGKLSGSLRPTGS